MMGLAAGGTKDGKKEMGAIKAANIVSILFADRTFAHMAHLKTSSYSTHMALNEFYDSEEEEDLDVTDLADSLAEVAQGRYGKLDIPVGQISTDLLMPADVLEASLDRILEEAEGCEGRSMNAIVDQIEELYLSTIYLIRELH